MLAVYLSPLYIAVNIWLLFRIQGWLGACHAIFRRRWVRAAVAFGYSLAASSMLIAFFLPVGPARRILKVIGNEWLGVMLYLAMAVLAAEGGRILYILVRRGRREKRATNSEGIDTAQGQPNWQMGVGRSELSCSRGKRASEWRMSLEGGTDVGKKGQMCGSGECAGRRLHAMVGVLCMAVVASICLWGTWNARVIRVTPYEITVDKDGGKRESLNVVLIADLHLGYSVGAAQMVRMVERINEQNADLVVIAGDIFDNEYEALEDPEKLAAILRGIRVRYGVYACYGNHDVEEKLLAGFPFGGSAKKQSSPEMDAFLDKAGIRLLRDEAVLIDDSVYLYGRPDAQRPGRGIGTRKTAAELTEGLDSDKPVLVLDHEPGELQELAAAGVDVALCGHTHDGQLFPGNLVTSLMWENSYGYLKKDGMHTIVTSGVGLFGPCMRVGTIAEICPVRIRFR